MNQPEPLYAKEDEHIRVTGPAITVDSLLERPARVIYEQVTDEDHYRRSLRGEDLYADLYPREQETTMPRFNATIIDKPETRSVNIYLEMADNPDTFLTKDLEGREEVMERDMGQEMPIYMTLPREIFDAIIIANRKGDGS